MLLCPTAAARRWERLVAPSTKQDLMDSVGPSPTRAPAILSASVRTNKQNDTLNKRADWANGTCKNFNCATHAWRIGLPRQAPTHTALLTCHSVHSELQDKSRQQLRSFFITEKDLKDSIRAVTKTRDASTASRGNIWTVDPLRSTCRMASTRSITLRKKEKT